MEKYVVKSGQNIYDIALTLHGTVEGVFDLLISNSQLGFDTELKSGDELNYNKSFVVNQDITTWLSGNGIEVRNGSHTYAFTDLESTVKQHFDTYHAAEYDKTEWMTPDERREYWGRLTKARMIVKHSGRLSTVVAEIHEGKHLFVDWGDYSGIEIYEGGMASNRIEHCYKDGGEHVQRYYGDFSCRMLDLSDLNGVYYMLCGMNVEEFVPGTRIEELNKLVRKEG